MERFAANDKCGQFCRNRFTNGKVVAVVNVELPEEETYCPFLVTAQNHDCSVVGVWFLEKDANGMVIVICTKGKRC